MKDPDDIALPEGLREVDTGTTQCDYCVGNNPDTTSAHHCNRLPSCGSQTNFMDEAMYIKWLVEARLV
jgi:hypothetical protein